MGNVMGNKFRNLIMLLTVSFLTVLSIFYFPDKSYSIDNITYEASNSKLELAPYSDEYLKWLSLPDDEKEKTPAPKTSDQPFVSLYKTSLFGKTRSIVEDVVIPAQYDLRNVGGVNYTTPIKNQGSLGLCWAYSASSALESNLKLNGQGNYNFNPIHANYILAYDFQGGSNNPYGIMELNNGGNFSYTSSYWTSSFGPVSSFSGNGTLPVSLTNTFVATSNIQIDNTYYLPSFNNYNATALERQEYNNIIKKQVMDNGGVYFHAAAPSGTYFNNTYDSVYTDNYTDYYNSPHAMVIIGWDDNYSRANFNSGRISGQRPTSNGAWIVQNSWGTSFGNNGYYYYSYEDYMIGAYMAGIISASTADYDNAYQYNPTGLMNQVSGNYGAVVFNKEDLKTESLTEVSFGVNQANTSYEIYVNAVDGSLTGSNVKLVQTSTTPIEYPGYHTVTLNNPVQLKGKEYAVIVHFINGGYYLVPARENGHDQLSKELVGIMPSQSYASFDGSNWVDTYYGGLDISVDIKAYTEDITPLSGTQIDTDLRNSNIVVDDANVNYVIGVNTITSNIASGAYLTYTVKNMVGSDVTNRFNIVKNPIIMNQANASITVPTGIEKGYYTVETKYNNNVDTDYFIVTDSLGTKVTSMYSKLNSAYVGLNETRDLNSFIEKTDDITTLNWVSSNPSIVSINNGIITGLQEGSAVITVSKTGGTLPDTINVTVNRITLIDNASQLNSIRNNLTGSYKLANDIDISAWDWIPIGNSTNPFVGTFNGNGHVIKGVKINDAVSDYQGLFGIIYTSSIKNITLLNSNITGRDNVGSLAGFAQLSELSDIFNVGGSVIGRNSTGGITGSIIDSGITRTFNTANITGSGLYTGGITGLANEINIVSSYNNGNISGIEEVGGMFGGIIASSIEQVFNTGNISGTTYMLGGIIGYGENFDLINAYNTGNILGSTSSYIGGIVGFGNASEYNTSLISKTYNIGNVQGGVIYIGGIFGSSSVGLSVTNNYDVSDSIPASGESGYATITNTVQKTLSELKSQATFVGFNFTNDWGIKVSEHPYLKSLPLLNDIIVDTSPLSLDIGEEITIDIAFDPDTVLNKIAVWQSSNEDVATVDNGVVTAIGAGNATITITANDGKIVKNIDVIVDSPITSNQYSIHSSYISEVSNETSFEAFVGQISIVEPETSIKIYQSDGTTECTAGIIGTNMILETTNLDKTIRFNIVVKGDVTGDGYVRVNDIIKINNHIIGYSPISNSSEILAADVTGDNNLRVNDIVKINNYIINPLINPLIEGK